MKPLTAKRKNHTLETLLSSRVPVDELTSELYLVAKSANISDSELVRLCNTTQAELTKFKREHELIGVTIPGYKKRYPGEHEYKVSNNPEVIVEGKSNQSLMPLVQNDHALEIEKLKELLIVKDREIHRLNDQASLMQEQLWQSNMALRSSEAEYEAYCNSSAQTDNQYAEEYRSVVDELQTCRTIVKQLATLI